MMATALTLLVMTPSLCLAQGDGTAGAAGPRLDVLFVIDTTGSMADEIQVVKDKVREMVAKIASGKPTPRARFGLVLYRDRGDDYVTRTTNLTEEIDDFVKAVNEIEANGGGDYPESVVEALHVAIHNVNWDPAPDVDKTIFLILDAPPHMDYPDDFDLKADVAKARDEGITIHVIGCSGLAESDAQFLQRNVAQAAEGTFNNLTYKRTYTDSQGRTATVLEAGGVAYALREGLGGAADWRKGAETLASAGLATPAPAVALPPAAAAGVAPAGPLTPGKIGDRGEKLLLGGAGGSTSGLAENNLDSLLVGVVQRQAERRGVRYVDTGNLDILARFEGAFSSQKTEKGFIVRDAAAWETLWKVMNANVDSLPELPKVDFEKNMVVAYFLGEKTSGGWGVTIRAVNTADGLTVTYAVRSPAPGAVTTTVMTYPYSVVVVPKCDGEPKWIKAQDQ
jgi:hypothetical protein